MRRLKQAEPRFGNTIAQPRVSPPAPQDEAGRSRWRREHQPWRNWYSTSAWRKIAEAAKLEACFTCAMCGLMDAGPGAMVADHIAPHRGNRDRFFDKTNVQCLCKACHDRHKQAIERAQGL